MTYGLAVSPRYKIATLDAGDTIVDLGSPDPFPVIAATDVKVFRTRADVRAPLVLDVDYAVSLLNQLPGARVTLAAGALQDDIIEVVGERPIARPTDFNDGQKFSEENLNAEFDALTIEQQEARRDINRTVTSPLGEAGLEMPEYDAGKAVVWDSTERKLTNAPVAAGDVAAAVIATAADRVATGLDRVQTGLDRVATAADVVLTHADVLTANAAVVDAEASADLAQLAAGPLYDTTALGIAATVDGQFFRVKGTNGGLVYALVYKNVVGVAVYQNIDIPSKAAVDQVRVIYDLDSGTTVFRATYPALNNAPASTFEAGGVVSIPAGGLPWFDVMITPTQRAALIAGVCDLAIVSTGGTVIDGATYEQYNGAAIIGAGVAMVREGNDFLKRSVAPDAAMTKFRFKLDNAPGTGTAKILYPEVRLVVAASTPSAETIDNIALVEAETAMLATMPVNIAADGPYSMRKLAGGGAAPTYNAATGEITVPADVQGEIVFINGPNILPNDTYVVDLKVVTDDTLAGIPGIFAIPVQGNAHSVGPGFVAELTKSADNLYWHVVAAGNDADGNAPGSIILRPDTRASGLKAAKQIVISDIWISRGSVRPTQTGLAEALEALRDTITPPSVEIDTAEDEALELSRALSSQSARKNAAYFVSANGSDAAAGGAETAFATLDHALDQAVASDAIGLYADAGNVNFRVNAYRTITDVDTLSIGALPATIDGRQHITGAWTLATGTSYTKDVIFREATVNNGVLSATWDYAVWDGEEALTWIVGGADIAANKAVVDATPGSFTIHRTGSAVQDPRSDISATGYTIYINRADGSDPTGADISTADIAIVVQFIGGTNSCRIIGAGWKDFAKSSSTDSIPTLENYVADQCKQHGWVGPAVFTGKRAEVNGVPSPGVLGVTFDRAGGGCINIFTGTYRDLDLVYPCEVFELNNNGYGLFGHGSGNQGYRSLDIPGLLRGRNLSIGVGFSHASVLLPFFKYGIRIGRVDLEDVDEAFTPGGSLEITRGGTVRLSNRSLNNGGNRTGLIKFFTSGEVFKATDLDIYSEDERGPGSGASKYLFWRGFTGSTAPTVHLRGCQDISPAGRKLSAFGSTNSAFAAHIILESSANRPTIVGDLVNLYVATGYLPASITVGAGTTFGFAGMTRAAMRAFFDANLVPHSISNDTTIVGPWDEIVELPA